MKIESSILKFKDEIALLNPMASGFIFNYNNWEKGFKYDKSFIELFKKYDNKEINRLIVLNSFRDYFKTKRLNCYIPFLLAMIWGHGPSGYGPSRTNKYFSSKSNLTHIRKAMQLFEMKNIYQAYAELLEVTGLNVSFASKVAYFASLALNIKEYPLIFDRRVASSLVSLFIDNKISKLISVSPNTDLESYKNYNILIHKWAKQIGVDADKIEWFLFNEDLK